MQDRPEGLAVTVLGCSGTWAAPGNACSGYLVETGSTRIWLDCGPGTLAALQGHCELEDLDAVVVSHSHPDHWTELPVLRNALRYGLDGRAGLPVVTTDEVRRLCDETLGGAGSSAPTFAWQVVGDGDEVTLGDVRLRFSRTDHPVETLAVLATAAGRTMVYSADTGPGWSPAAFGERIDLLVCEATLGRDEEGRTQHLSGRQAGRAGAEAGVERLVLTHLWPRGSPGEVRADASEAFGSSVPVARPGSRFDV